jgi:FKBP-type peptidyl-prolyl cis-trans isomerase FkpA
MIKLIFSYLFVCLLVLSACNDRLDKDYLRVSEQCKFKIISFNSETSRVEAFDLVEFKSTYLKNNKSTLIADSSKLNELYNDTITFNPAKQNDIMQVIGKLQEGDSCLVLFYNDSPIKERLNIKPHELSKNDTIYAYIKIKHIYKANDKLAYRLEENAIARYISFSQKHWTASENGIYYHLIKSSAHEKLKYGDNIKIVYKGYFLNGQIFDNYASINPYFEHSVGTQNQLIAGMEIALKYLSYGAEAEFIFPSKLAFGDQGSSTGIVAGFKPVLYRVKILEQENL